MGWWDVKTEFTNSVLRSHFDMMSYHPAVPVGGGGRAFKTNVTETGVTSYVTEHNGYVYCCETIGCSVYVINILLILGA